MKRKQIRVTVGLALDRELSLKSFKWYVVDEDGVLRPDWAKEPDTQKSIRIAITEALRQWRASSVGS